MRSYGEEPIFVTKTKQSKTKTNPMSSICLQEQRERERGLLGDDSEREKRFKFFIYFRINLLKYIMHACGIKY